MSKSIFKYFGFRDYDLDALCSSYLWFSKLEEFNDPFEGLYEEQTSEVIASEFNDDRFMKIFYHYQKVIGADHDAALNAIMSFTSQPDYKQKAIGKYKNIERQLRIIYQKYKKRIFCSFTLGSYGNKNKLMWSHYGAGLTGYCIEYNRDKLVSSLKERNSIAERLYTASMVYHSAVPNPIDERISQTIKLDPINNPGVVVTRKCAEWSYENEFRISINPQEERKLAYDSSVIESITIGEKMSDVKRNTLFMCLKGLFGDSWKDRVKVAYICRETFEFKIKALADQ